MSWLLGLLLLAGVGAEGGIKEEADAAFHAEQHARALELYEQLLRDQPENIHALLRSARLLSWDGKLEASLDRYRRALQVNPESRPAALGHATVLSWDGRMDRAIDEFTALYERFPNDREILLALARTLSWDGRYDEARAHYEALLDRDPGDVEAMLGTARTYAWSGHLSRARQWYDRTLAVDESNKDAQVGNGYVDLWSGDVGRAARRADSLGRTYPDDKDVREFNARVREARAPWVRLQTEQIDDTDANRLRIHQVIAGWRVARNIRLGFGLSRFEMEDRIAEASIDSLHGQAEFRPARGQSLTVRAAVDRRETTAGDRESDTLGSAVWAWGLDRRWQVRLAAARDAVRYSPTITDAGVTFDTWTASAGGAVANRWRLSFVAGGGEVSDDNDRRNALAAAHYRWPVKPLVLETGYMLRYLDYDRDTPSGYFDPSGFVAHLLQVRGRGEFGKHDNSYSFGVDTGLQSFTLGATEIDNDTVIVLQGTVGFPLGRAFRFEMFGNWGDYAAQTAAGFESRQLGLRLRWLGDS